ncbi:hypothetical protein [Pseudoalteromonas sp. R3]|uniref:hypothetical protein n=1 Tax=Pseudoalteromonas sp. R3 TaxID=1709477 RepID=UPI0006B5C161|nr:hypothetical protein [Pseudoalteromonas sp. R3]AZZ98498.1 hypothetical protein ELR70_16095 [Pseudoalteromonas sp. R3]
MRLVLFSLLIFLGNSALACKYSGCSDEELLYQAEEVLLVKVLATELIDAETNIDEKVKIGFRIVEAF